MNFNPDADPASYEYDAETRAKMDEALREVPLGGGVYMSDDLMPKEILVSDILHHNMFDVENSVIIPHEYPQQLDDYLNPTISFPDYKKDLIDQYDERGFIKDYKNELPDYFGDSPKNNWKPNENHILDFVLKESDDALHPYFDLDLGRAEKDQVVKFFKTNDNPILFEDSQRELSIPHFNIQTMKDLGALVLNDLIPELNEGMSKNIKFDALNSLAFGVLARLRGAVTVDQATPTHDQLRAEIYGSAE